MKNAQRIIIILLMSVLVASCASSRSGSVYTRGEARQVQTVRFAVLEDARPVLIEGTPGTVGTTAGAVIGGIAGTGVGGGRGTAIATVVGAVVGGLIGAAVEEGTTSKQGLELTVRLENTGQILAVVQEVNEGEVFIIGSRVKVIDNGISTRVSNFSNAPGMGTRPLPLVR
jgi:outer membrane lipoprotein SlyB